MRDSFVAGFDAGFRVNAAVARAGLVIAVLFVGGSVRPGRGSAAKPSSF